MNDADRHNKNLLPIFRMIVKDENGRLVKESDAMVLLESVITGVLMVYRPDPRHAAEYLDLITVRVLERVANGGQPS